MTNFKRLMPILYVSVLGACLLVAASDEFHQTFVSSRGPSARDVMIDTAGAIVGLLIGAIFGVTRPIRHEKATADP
jgi:VanZ family protein